MDLQRFAEIGVDAESACFESAPDEFKFLVKARNGAPDSSERCQRAVPEQFDIPPGQREADINMIAGAVMSVGRKDAGN